MTGAELFVAAMTAFTNGDPVAGELIAEAPRDVLQDAFISALAGMSGTLRAVALSLGVDGDELVTTMMRKYAIEQAAS